jgi:hypothetical protein
MRVMIDQEAMLVLRQICDAALKGAGLGIMDQVNRLSACIQPFPVLQPKAEEQRKEPEVKEVAKDEQKEEQKEETKTTETKEVS